MPQGSYSFEWWRNCWFLMVPTPDWPEFPSSSRPGRDVAREPPGPHFFYLPPRLSSTSDAQARRPKTQRAASARFAGVPSLTAPALQAAQRSGGYTCIPLRRCKEEGRGDGVGAAALTLALAYARCWPTPHHNVGKAFHSSTFWSSVNPRGVPPQTGRQQSATRHGATAPSIRRKAQAGTPRCN